MDIIIKPEVAFNLKKFLKRIDNGDIFIYPTDTIYGIGCDATNSEAVTKLRKIKERPEKPLSIIAPNKDWILRNCHVNETVMAWLEKLPGAYTLILRLKNKNAIAPEVNNFEDTVGIRIPNHWISDVINFLNKPIITTSANVSSHDFMTSLENLEPEIMQYTDFMVYEGEKRGRPSVIVNLEDQKEIICTR